MPAYQYCNVANVVNTISALMMAVELNKTIYSWQLNTHKHYVNC